MKQFLRAGNEHRQVGIFRVIEDCNLLAHRIVVIQPSQGILLRKARGGKAEINFCVCSSDAIDLIGVANKGPVIRCMWRFVKGYTGGADGNDASGAWTGCASIATKGRRESNYPGQ